MRILHIITSLYTGGAEKLMVDLLPHLKEKGVEVDLLLLDGTNTPFRNELEKRGIKVLDLGKGGCVYSPLKLLKLIPIVKNYDIIHTHNTAAQLFGAFSSLLNSKVYCTTEHSTSNRRRKWKWYVPIDRWMYSRYKEVICISSDTVNNLKGYLKDIPTQTVLIYNGIDVARIKSSKISNVKKNYPNCGVALIQVAGFRYQKDQDTVIKAIKNLPETYHLFLVGDGERRCDLEKLVENLGLQPRIHFLGIRQDVAELIKSCDIVVMSSHLEGFGLAAIEGMAAGKPVIATNIPGLREVVEGAGLLFRHMDVSDLSKQVLYLMESPHHYSEIQEKCAQRVLSFDISKMADGYISVYQSLMRL